MFPIIPFNSIHFASSQHTTQFLAPEMFSVFEKNLRMATSCIVMTGSALATKLTPAFAEILVHQGLVKVTVAIFMSKR
jgi:hypothetical protein